MNGLPWSYLWVAVNLLLILYVVRRLLGRPLATFLDGRRRGVSERFDQAGDAVRSAASLKDGAAGRLAGAAGEKEALLEAARSQMESLTAQSRRVARQESDRILERARTGIAREQDLAVKALWRGASSRTLDAARLVLAQVTVDSDDERLVRELLAGLGEVDV